jgi:hypothetical protein
MKFNAFAAAVLATLPLASPPAFATATASATLAGLRLTIGKFDPAGPAPSATITSGGVDSAYAGEHSAEPYGEQDVWHYGASSFGAAASSTVVGPGMWSRADASLSGDVLAGAGAEAATSAFANGTLFGAQASGEGTLQFGATKFTLGANTFVDISARYTLATSTHWLPLLGGDEEYADADASLFVLDGDFRPRPEISASYALSSFSLLDSAAKTASGDLDVFLLGSPSAYTTFYVYGDVSSTASSTLPGAEVSTVPEPAGLALCLAGLGAVALRLRRARAGGPS